MGHGRAHALNFNAEGQGDSDGAWKGACLELLQREVETGHGHTGHAPQLLLHAQDGRPIHVQQLCRPDCLKTRSPTACPLT